MLCLVSGDWLAVVADVDTYRVVGGSIGGNGDGRGSCFHGILQYVRHDMGDEAFVGVEEKVGERDVLVYIRCFGIFLDYRHHSFKEGFDVEEFELWLGDERHSAVVIYKVEQLLARGIDNR